MTKSTQLPKNKLLPKQVLSKTGLSKNTPVLSDEINAAIASKITATTPVPEVALRIKSRLMQRVQADTHEFVFAAQGKWKTIHEGVQVKLLHKVGNAKSFLMKMAVSASIPGHLHAHDEESFVLDGDVTIEGILCTKGDYHYAHAGSQHEALKTIGGCTLLIKSCWVN
jgi:anti-sigma factor ChrR (cupin superfamily)